MNLIANNLGRTAESFRGISKDSLVLPGIILAHLGLMALGKISGDFLQEKIGKLNTLKLSLVGLVTGALIGATAMLYESLLTIWIASSILVFSGGMSIRKETELNPKKKFGKRKNKSK
jgi:hypothetical protein